ncbi:MAG: sugar phosphate nucleotidyltransferase, partial [Nitrospirota bacterium]|nr:sugar phosphate nucleotidyltransferase [Nitrospirota bacterium]
FVGERSLFQHTLERADQFNHREQTITVISQAHKEIASQQMAHHAGGGLLIQPRNCDTGPGVFLPLSYLKLLAADATVIILPSDHFIFPAHRFRRVLNSAVNALTNHSDQLILLGVRPNTPETEYGWIKPGALVRKNGLASLYQVESFIEKPTVFNAQHLMETGGLWNTMILVGKLATFWNLGWLVLPNLMQKFRAFQAFIGSQWEHSMLQHIYVDMPVCNLSKEFLQKIPNHLTVLEMSNILWSDWGNPNRISETLLAIGKTPNFLSDKLNGFLSKPLGAPPLPTTQSS